MGDSSSNVGNTLKFELFYKATTKLSEPASKHNAIDIIWTWNNTKEEIDLEELCFEEQTIFTVS